MPISVTTAALGGETGVPSLDGAAKIRIPAETQSGKVFRLRGKGIKGVPSGTHGDLMCHVVVETHDRDFSAVQGLPVLGLSG